MVTNRPIKGKKTTLSQAFEECFADFPLLNHHIKNLKK